MSGTSFLISSINANAPRPSTFLLLLWLLLFVRARKCILFGGFTFLASFTCGLRLVAFSLHFFSEDTLAGCFGFGFVDL